MKVTFATFVLVAGLVVAVGCGGGEDGDKTFEGDGYSFTYPGDWTDYTGNLEAMAQAGSGPATSKVAVAPRRGQDIVLVEVGPTSPPITEDNIDEFESEIVSLVESLFQEGGGRLTSGPTRLAVGELPALRFEGTGSTSEGVSIRSRLTLIYDGPNQYAVNCQFTPAGAEEVTQACDQVLGSFHVEGGGGSAGEDNTFEGDGYSFTHPDDWYEFEEAESRVEAGDELSSVSVGPRAGADTFDVAVYRVRIAITEENIDELSDDLVAEIGPLIRQGGGRITKGPEPVTVDGLPGLRLEASVLDPDGVRVQSRMIFVFDGTTEYFLNCQFTPEGAKEMTRGCKQVVESFQIERRK